MPSGGLHSERKIYQLEKQLLHELDLCSAIKIPQALVLWAETCGLYRFQPWAAVRSRRISARWCIGAAVGTRGLACCQHRVCVFTRLASLERELPDCAPDSMPPHLRGTNHHIKHGRASFVLAADLAAVTI